MIYECQELDDWSCCNDVYIWNPSMCDCDCNKACKIDEYLDIKKCLCKKCLFGKLLLACEGEMINTTKTSFDNKKVACKKNNCLIHNSNYMLFIISYISIRCCY